MADFRKPNINAPTAEGQLKQIRDYLCQFTDKLNITLKAAEDGEKIRQQSSLANNKNSSESNVADNTTENTFLAVKNLIIKSADIVNAYYDIIQTKLEGEYEALSEFGDYKEKTEYLMEQTPKNKTEYYDLVQEIYDKTGNLSELRKDGFYMRTGWLDDDAATGNKIGGIEIGQVSEGAEEERKSMARFTPNELAFYDGQGTTDEHKLAWFSKYTLTIREAKIKGNLYLGGYKLDTSNGIAFKWVGDE